MENVSVALEVPLSVVMFEIIKIPKKKGHVRLKGEIRKILASFPLLV